MQTNNLISDETPKVVTLAHNNIEIFCHNNIITVYKTKRLEVLNFLKLNVQNNSKKVNIL